MRYFVSILLLFGLSMFVIADNEPSPKDARVQRFDDIPLVGMLPNLALPKKLKSTADVVSAMTTSVELPSIPEYGLPLIESLPDLPITELVDVVDEVVNPLVSSADEYAAVAARTVDAARLPLVPQHNNFALKEVVSPISGAVASAKNAAEQTQSVLVGTVKSAFGKMREATKPAGETLAAKGTTLLTGGEIAAIETTATETLDAPTNVGETAAGEAMVGETGEAAIGQPGSEVLLESNIFEGDPNAVYQMDQAMLAAPISYAPAGNSYYFQTQFMFLDQFGDARVETSFDNMTGQTALNAHDADLDLSPALEIRVGRKSGSSAVELGWWSLFANSGESAASGTIDSAINFGALDIDFNGASKHKVKNELEMHSIDLSRRQLLTGWGSPAFNFAYQYGLRYTEIDDEFRLTADDIDEYAIEVNNHLIGPQIGGAAYWQATSKVGLLMDLKGGMYFNFADQDQSVNGATITSGPNSGRPFAINTNDSEASLLGEFQLGAECMLTNRFRFMLGYRVVAASGVGLARHQIPRGFRAVDVPIDTSGSLLLHGIQFGIDGSF